MPVSLMSLRTEKPNCSFDRMTALILANVQDAVYVTDLLGMVTYWNEGATCLYGWSAAELIGRPIAERYPESVRGMIADVTQSILKGEEWSGEWQDYRKDGSMIWINARVTRILDHTGAPIGIMAFSHDISARKRAEAERDQVLRQLQVQIERMPIGCVLTDAGLRVVDWNPAAERIFGYTREEAVGMAPPYEKLVPKHELKRVGPILGHIHHGNSSVHVVNQNITKDGRIITCEWTNTPLFDADGHFTGMVSLAQDITARRNLEEQLRQSHKMEAIGQLAGGVAHDFNNLLTVINGYSDMVLFTMAPGDKNRERVEEIKKAGERSASLTRQLLAFSRKQVLAPKILKLNDVVHNTEKMLRRMIGEDVELITRLSPTLDCVRADPGQMEQVLLNLAVNARDAMPQGGRLILETENMTIIENDAREHPDLRPGAYVVLRILDTGTGMNEEVARRVFEPYFSTKGSKGTGLGLAVVHGIVKQSDGEIDFRSTPGGGTQFRIFLPSVVSAGSEATQGRRSNSMPRGTETILLVEDDMGVRALTSKILGDCGYTLLVADGGESALTIAAGHAGPIQLLLSDVVMPGFGGRVLAEKLVALHPRMKVIYFSGYTNDDIIRHGIFHEQVNFVQKPFSPAALAQKVHDVLSATEIRRASAPERLTPVSD